MDAIHVKNTGALPSSPLKGIICRELGIIKKLYDAKIDSANVKLVKELFYQKDKNHPLRNTQSKSKAAYFLTSEIIAKIMHYFDEGTFDSPKTREALCFEMTPSISKSKILQLLNIMSNAKKECGSRYPTHMTENILLTFLSYKAEKPNDYLNTLHQLSPTLRIKAHEFNDNDLEIGKNILQQVRNIALDSNPEQRDLHQSDILKIHYEEIISHLIIADALPEVMITDVYGYNNQTPVPNCVEAAYHNLINIILHDGKIFNFRQLPTTLKPHEKLLAFYERQSFKATKVNAQEVGQLFMDMVSGHDFLSYYNNKNYELNLSLDNFIPLMNHLFGSHATSFQELSEQFSDIHRQINFVKTKEAIEISIISKTTLIIKFDFSANHVRCIAPEALKSSSDDRIPTIPKHCDPLLAALLHKKDRIDCILHHKKNLTLEDLNILLIYYSPKNKSEKRKFFAIVAPYLETYPILKNSLLEFANTHLDITEFMADAIFGEHVLIIKTLLQIGINPNIQNSKDESLLHLAIHASEGIKPEIVTLLLDAGVNPQLADRWNKTPLFYAKNSPKIVKLLLEEMANRAVFKTEPRPSGSDHGF